MPLGEGSRAFIIPGGSEPMPLNPRWYTAAASFIELGIEHILSGTDHLLFLFCLVIPFRRWRGLFSVITAFTLAHSVTLFASAFNLAPKGAWFAPFVETAIAASIAYMAIENLFGPNLRRRWLTAGMFGLVHGFGFADILAEKLQFAGSYLLLSLFSFNVGIEIGQMLVLLLVLPALMLCRRFVPERALVVTLSTMGALIASYWMFDRFQVLRQRAVVCDARYSAAAFTRAASSVSMLLQKDVRPGRLLVEREASSRCVRGCCSRRCSYGARLLGRRVTFGAAMPLALFVRGRSCSSSDVIAQDALIIGCARAEAITSCDVSKWACLSHSVLVDAIVRGLRAAVHRSRS